MRGWWWQGGWWWWCGREGGSGGRERVRGADREETRERDANRQCGVTCVQHNTLVLITRSMATCSPPSSAFH